MLRRSPRRPSATVAPAVRMLWIALFSCLLLSPGLLHAGGDEPSPKDTRSDAEKRAAIFKKPHLDYRKTYGGALLESRIRNLPVFVSRHKDY